MNKRQKTTSMYQFYKDDQKTANSNVTVLQG